ncbi:MAG: hypothetical protein MH186_10155 [Marinobacter sp.]|nr:hypothetical protein [Marinobacter sp.]
MSSYRGVDFKVRSKIHPDTGKHLAEFSLTVHKGYQVEDHPFTYLLIKGTDDLAEFDTEDAALEAATSTAKYRIDEITE